MSCAGSSHRGAGSRDKAVKIAPGADERGGGPRIWRDGDVLRRLVAVVLVRVDLPMLSATILLGAALILLANIVVDVLYSVIDPRVRLF